MNRSGQVEDVLAQLQDEAEGSGRMSVGDAIDAIGQRGYGPLIFIPALMEISPIGGIPGIPSVIAVIIAIFAAQIALGRESLWLPDVLRRQSVSESKMVKATGKLQPVAHWLDRWFPGRWRPLTTVNMRRIAAGLCVLLCLAVPPLEIFPFASSVPMAAIAAFGLAMTLRDGVLMALGFALAGAAVLAGGMLA